MRNEGGRIAISFSFEKMNRMQKEKRIIGKGLYVGLRFFDFDSIAVGSQGPVPST